MSNNNDNKKPLDLTESLLLFDKAQAPSTTTVNVGDVELGIPEINRVAAAPKNLVQSAEASTTTPTVNELDYDGISLVEMSSVKPGEKNDSLGISGINQPDVTTRNLSRSDELTIGFLLDCAKRGQNRGNQRQPSICKVSRMLRDHSESSYEPQLVSIGPIHREDPKLQEFEWQKECYLNDLLKRCHDSTPRERLEECLLKVNTLLPKIRESYAGVKKNYSDVELARMMVMDGCFILEFCFKHEEADEYLPNKMQTTRIAMDLMLLENQVPFSVLQALFKCSMGEVHFTLNDVLDEYLVPYIKIFRSDLLPEKNSILSNFLNKFLAQLFRSPLSEKNTTDVASDSTDHDVQKKKDSTDHDHVLGYLHKRYQPVDAKSKIEEEERKEKTVYHLIAELDRSGVNFMPHQEDDCSMTIKFTLFSCLSGFWSKSTLLMPTLLIDDFTELILRNFIAYEQSFLTDRYYFTSYAHAMDKLIDSKEDIAKLVESKVLVNNLGSNQEAADMINKICKNISFTDFCYTQEFKQMDRYYNDFWTKSLAPLRRVLRDDPWSYSNIFLLYLGMVQTYYTIRGSA